MVTIELQLFNPASGLVHKTLQLGVIDDVTIHLTPELNNKFATLCRLMNKNASMIRSVYKTRIVVKAIDVLDIDQMVKGVNKLCKDNLATLNDTIVKHNMNTKATNKRNRRDINEGHMPVAEMSKFSSPFDIQSYVLDGVRYILN